VEVIMKVIHSLWIKILIFCTIILAIGVFGSIFYENLAKEYIDKYGNNNIHPSIITPGSSIRYYPTVEKIPCIDGIWKGNVFSVKVEYVSSETGEKKNINCTQMHSNFASWNDKLEFKNISGNIPISYCNIWVDFTLPDNDELYGKEVKISVFMTVQYPELLPGGRNKFRDADLEINESLAINIPDINRYNESKGIIRMEYIFHIILLVAVGILILELFVFLVSRKE
jgi:hypothetical protein